MKVSDGFARRPGSLIFGIDEVGNRQTAYQIRGTADRGEYRQAKPASPRHRRVPEQQFAPAELDNPVPTQNVEILERRQRLLPDAGIFAGEVSW
jgi:hypothetical protein